MSKIRDDAQALLDSYLPQSGEIRSNGSTAAKFTEMTGGGYTQKTLTDAWAAGKNLTSCNGFTGWYGQKMGSKLYLGVFDLKAIAQKAGRPRAWVPSTRDNRPSYGDILRHASFHVDVCLGFEGSVLCRAAGGQGGKSLGYDIIKRVKGTSAYSYSKLLGWLDLDIFFGSAAAAADASWLTGWWTINDGTTYYYYFFPTGDVQYVSTQPTGSQPPTRYASDTGKFTYSAPGILTIDWNPTSPGTSTETYRDAYAGASSMHGTSAVYPPLTATKRR
jgi:hypothetical protein